jgi:S1-C subfamily serine protease
MELLERSVLGVNLLDLLLIVVLVLTALGGFRAGLISRLSGWIGLLAGLVVSFFAVPVVLGFFDGGAPITRFLIAIAVLSITVTVLSSLFQRIGLGLVRVIHRTPLRGVDRAAGAVAAVAVLGMLLWLLIPAAALVPGTISAQVRSSAVLGAVQDSTPPPPDAIGALGNLVDRSRFPDVFDDLRPAPDTGPPPSEIPVPPDVVEAATASTVRVNSTGCSRRYVGSGWTVADGLVATNAHVVAGADEISVRRPDGQVRDARVVRFDADRDLAVLEVADLGQSPLPLGSVVAGGDGASIGYPGGQELPRVAPVSVREQRTTNGRDIYRERPATREVVFLAAELRQGDSGSPVIDANGDVVGIVFAISPDRSTTAYALAPEELEDVLAGPATSDPGRCL